MEQRYEAVAELMSQSWNDPKAPNMTILVPLIDVLRNNYPFDWEREWRVPHSIKFGPKDVSFMLFPEEEHESFSAYCTSNHAKGMMSLYDCPLIDHRWPKERIRVTLG